MMAPFVIDHVELAENYALIQMAVPESWQGKTLAELDLRRKHKVTVVAIRRRTHTSSETGLDAYEERIVDVPLPSSRLSAEDTLMIAGFNVDLEKLPG